MSTDWAHQLLSISERARLGKIKKEEELAKKRKQVKDLKERKLIEQEYREILEKGKNIPAPGSCILSARLQQLRVDYLNAGGNYKDLF